MKLCNTHAHDLLSILKRKGMGGMISSSSEEVSRKAALWLAGQLGEPRDFDPYVASTLEVFGKAKEVLGEVPHDVCPLCAVQHRLGCAEAWIDNVTDAMVLVCETNGLRRA